MFAILRKIFAFLIIHSRFFRSTHLLHFYIFPILTIFYKRAGPSCESDSRAVRVLIAEAVRVLLEPKRGKAVEVLVEAMRVFVKDVRVLLDSIRARAV